MSRDDQLYLGSQRKARRWDRVGRGMRGGGEGEGMGCEGRGGEGGVVNLSFHFSKNLGGAG